MKRWDVLISGYGPVGATLAILLGQQGLRVLILEQSSTVFDKPRAIGMDHEAMRVMQECGIAEALVEKTRPFRGAQWIGVDGQVIEEIDPHPGPFPLGWAPNFTFIQPQLETLLRERVSQLDTIDVRLGWKLTEVEQSDTGVEVRASNVASNDIMSFEADYLLACDGAGSTVRTKLGIGVEDHVFDEWWMVVDAFLKRPVALPETGRQFCNPQRPTSYIPGPQGTYRWELKVMPHEQAEDFKQPENILRALAPFVETDALDICRSAVYRFHALIAKEWRRGKVLLVGDAAHQTPPFMGQGLCSGIRDAVNLAWKLRMVHQGLASSALLDAYEAERRPHVTTLITRTKAIGEQIGELDVARARERDARMVQEMAEAPRPRLRQSLIPLLDSGVLDPQRSPASGHLLVQPTVRNAQGALSLLDDQLANGFLLITTTPQAQAWLGPEELRHWNEIGGERLVLLGSTQAPLACELSPVLRETASLFQRMALEHGFEAVIVRPDRTVFGSAVTREDLCRLLRALHAQLQPTHHNSQTKHYNEEVQ
ncbi:bifunctional 3-(3-hydroxy-phenyl)propionate/3-hydroxycinnamic acid hydroxylase [Diaphorobacter sp. HDW4A]|uniref:bifunctional 3-(3-hydroxy-phenyl)propionate/3-hydroxycinnamic acid hydroxylase MhpA n=1 Tax=Diaphorobacter sp. HDW4A TaxID=2714924 RepID=UPI00140B35A0|nr:bifunctional 3-(3-hydroxy-phenyl)propionate/3-hydroxycinnamic acid hydroxylase [Diaphorobacter sp. HDW4A]QIL79420.1 bifunctional 3-(3-hydroxy-phenyl)propionate/3-hydroxycinnamic acid hydroxylase [Diaphorobacter sp. HDW4A]